MRLSFTQLRHLSSFALLLAATSFFACRSTESTAIDESSLIKPAELANVLQSTSASKPHVIHVGFAALYNANHIPGSSYAGPGANDAGIAKLKAAVALLPKDANIVLYCGCCPWANCPNVRPALAAMKADGFTNTRVLSIDENFGKDWIDKGYPTE